MSKLCKVQRFVTVSAVITWWHVPFRWTIGSADHPTAPAWPLRLPFVWAFKEHFNTDGDVKSEVRFWLGGLSPDFTAGVWITSSHVRAGQPASCNKLLQTTGCIGWWTVPIYSTIKRCISDYRSVLRLSNVRCFLTLLYWLLMVISRFPIHARQVDINQWIRKVYFL